MGAFLFGFGYDLGGCLLYTLLIHPPDGIYAASFVEDWFWWGYRARDGELVHTYRGRKEDTENKRDSLQICPYTWCRCVLLLYAPPPNRSVLDQQAVMEPEVPRARQQ